MVLDTSFKPNGWVCDLSVCGNVYPTSLVTLHMVVSRAGASLTLHQLAEYLWRSHAEAGQAMLDLVGQTQQDMATLCQY